MIVSDYLEESQDTSIRISALFTLEGGTKFHTGNSKETLYFEFPKNYSGYTGLTADPFALLALPIATNANERLSIEGTISSSLYLNMLEIIHIYNWYFPNSSNVIELNCITEKRKTLASRLL